jgi:proteasome lid subunit RPN8/RPN11
MVDPKEQFAVMKEMRQEGFEIVAIYHSHPHADTYPSLRDIKLAFYPDAVYVIVSLIDEEPKITAFTIRDEKVKEVEMKIILK